MPRGQKDAAFYDSAALFVLSLLEEADKTGFQLLHEVECRSDCAFAIRESRLYPLLHGLEARGDVRSCERRLRTARTVLPADPSGRENAHLLPGTVENLPQANRRWRLCHQIS